MEEKTIKVFPPLWPKNKATYLYHSWRERGAHWDPIYLSIRLPLVYELPQSEDEWKRIANGFFQRWNFPHCVGAIDGKHISLQSPFHSESTFYNYKRSFSIILLALVDADYCFTFIDVGAQGRMNDAGVLACTILYRKMLMKELLLPPDESLPGRQLSVPYVLIGDGAFPLSTSILIPYAGNHA
ncbi:hypothetical protein J437_LFUL016860 [Ladona fulva]|uniref:DDE Tnp4 domain-containing protein n=1 Tax=Ladona fulva TaxID=123851 RepID=A0A8K0P5D7_LADFU|nr:hypothetical protein J437_LFUL016860 [Ladona fulva]